MAKSNSSSFGFWHISVTLYNLDPLSDSHRKSPKPSENILVVVLY